MTYLRGRTTVVGQLSREPKPTRMVDERASDSVRKNERGPVSIQQLQQPSSSSSEPPRRHDKFARVRASSKIPFIIISVSWITICLAFPRRAFCFFFTLLFVVVDIAINHSKKNKIRVVTWEVTRKTFRDCIRILTNLALVDKSHVIVAIASLNPISP